MSGIDDLLEADAARRAAMISADTTALARYLDENLIWTHSSGKTESRAEVLAAIESGSVVYLELETEGLSVRQHGEIFLLHGTLRGRAARDGNEKALSNRFLSVWKLADGDCRLLAWQSTGL